MGALLGTVAGAALLVAGAAGCSSSSGGGSGSLSQPDTIASLKKSPDQSMAKEILKAAKGQTGAGKLTAVVYQDSSNSSKTVMIYGGENLPVPAGPPAKQIKVMLKSGTRVGIGTKLGHELPVPAGSAGGVAKCAPLISPGSTLKFVTCGWVHGKSVLVMSFGGFDAKSAKSLVPQIIAAVVKS